MLTIYAGCVECNSWFVLLAPVFKDSYVGYVEINAEASTRVFAYYLTLFKTAQFLSTQLWQDLDTIQVGGDSPTFVGLKRLILGMSSEFKKV